MADRQAGFLRSVVRGLAAALLVLAGAALSPPVAAQAPVPAEAFFGPPDMDQPVLSPSGRYLAVLVRGEIERNALLVLDLQDNGKSRGLARYVDADITAVHWLGDERLLYSLVEPEAGVGRGSIAPGLFVVPREGGKPRQLVKIRDDPFFREATIGPDRRLDWPHVLLHVPPGGGTEVVLGQLDFDAARQLRGIVPMRFDVDRMALSPLASGLKSPALHWLFDAGGMPRLAAGRQDGHAKVWWRGAGGEWSVLLDADTLAMPWAPHDIDADGQLYVTLARGAEGQSVLARYDFARGGPAGSPAVAVPGFDFQGTLVHEHEGGRTLGFRVLTDGEITHWTDPMMKALQGEIDRRLPGRANRLSCRLCDSDERVVLVESFADRDPGTYLVWQGGKLKVLGQRRKAIAPGRMAGVRFETVQARDGRRLPVWVTLPARAEGAPPPPAVVLVHGGPWSRGSTWAWHALPQFLASRGYAVIEPEFRGSTGFGEEHFRAGWRQWGRAMQDDVTDAVRWAVAQGHADGGRLCIMGGSYGGYAALMGLVRDPDLYRCGVAFAAVSDPMRLLESSWWWADDVSEDVRRHDRVALIGDPVADAEMLAAVSPVKQAARIKAPVLLAHGERDRRVPLVHAREMREALRRNGTEPEWLELPDEGHSWRKTASWLVFSRKVEDFLQRQLK